MPVKTVEVSIEVTHDCPLKCIMCSSNANHPSPIENELSLDEIKRIIDDSLGIGTSVISLSGGEPSQRPDIKEIVKYILNKNLELLFYSSGIHMKNDVLSSLDLGLLKLLKNKRSRLILNIQSHRPRVHDRIIGIDGAFDLTMETVKKAKDLGIDLEVHFVPQKLNINDVIDYIYWLDELGIKRASFLRLVPQGRARENHDDVMISREDFKKLQETFIDLMSRKDLRIKIRLGHPIDRRWMLDPEKYEIKSCRGPRQAPLIKPDGWVDICPAYKDLRDFSAGNVRRSSIQDIWLNSHIYKTLRWFIEQGYESVENECRECPYLGQCKCGCVAQRLIEFRKSKDYTNDIKQALLKAPKDPMCFIDF